MARGTLNGSNIELYDVAHGGAARFASVRFGPFATRSSQPQVRPSPLCPEADVASLIRIRSPSELNIDRNEPAYSLRSCMRNSVLEGQARYN